MWNPTILTNLTTLTTMTILTNLTNLTTKKSNRNCDVRAVSHSFDVFFELFAAVFRVELLRC